MFGAGFAWSLRHLQDTQTILKRTTTPVYLRYRNFGDISSKQFMQLGFRTKPDPSKEAVGTSDVLVEPTPSIQTMSLHNIGISGGKLRFGAKTFFISSVFVNREQARLQLSDPKLVFNQCLGIMNENMMYSIEDVQHEIVGAAIINWMLVCNANEVK